MVKKSEKPEKIIWLDLEMTGLDANADLILESAAIITDWDFNELGVYEGVVGHENSVLEERFKANGAFWDKHQNAHTNLLEQNIDGKASAVVEDELLAFIDAHFAAGQTVLLGGNSIHMDRRFITAYWPRLDTRLYYRMLDVSAWKVVFEGKYGKRFIKPEAHRALGDIRGSILELKYYLDKVKI